MTREPGLLERFHEELVESIRREAPSYLRDTFTVAEIYQSLVPYRTHRDRLGVEMNGDYEDALLRLLAGEGDFLILESDPARARIQRELEHRNPNTGIYREFAAVEVRLNPEQVPPAEDRPTHGVPSDAQTSLGDFGAPGPGPGADADATESDGAAGPEPASGERADGGLGGGRVSAAARSSATAQEGGIRSKAAARPAQCPECSRDLPERASLQFCPHCGTNVLEVPCRSCGEILERGWEYCVACGTPTRG